MIKVHHSHTLWCDLDKDPPAFLCDRNDLVVKDCCRECGKMDADLERVCNRELQSDELQGDLWQFERLDMGNRRTTRLDAQRLLGVVWATVSYLTFKHDLDLVEINAARVAEYERLKREA